MCVGKSVPGTLGGWHDWILAAYFGDWYISVLWTRNVLILNLRQQNAWENKLCLIVVFLGAEESSCCGGGAASPTQHLGVSELSSSVCSENNNWPGLCVFGLNQHVPFLIKELFEFVTHFMLTLNCLKNGPQMSTTVKEGLTHHYLVLTIWKCRGSPNWFWIWFGMAPCPPSLLSEFIFKSNCCRAHAFPAVGWSILGMHGGGKVSEKQFQGGLCTYIPGH